MNKRVYGVLGISSIMANWNADFSGYPKTTSDGSIFGSDKAFKYPIKKLWENEGKKVLYIKSYKLSEDKKEGTRLTPRSLKERYEQVFGINDLADIKDGKKVISDIFHCTDVKNFGATFAEKSFNISITGAVQIGQGFNKYEDSTAEEQQILSPFRDSTKDNKKATKEDEKEGEAKNSTLGTKIVSNEAHYMYPFAINPMAYKEYIELDVTNGYTEEDYLEFKKASLIAATSYATNAKIGCENELGVFVETKPDVYLPNLAERVKFTKGEKINEIELNFGSLLAELKDGILNVEIYYNPYTTNIITDIEGARKFNIFTKNEVK